MHAEKAMKLSCIFSHKHKNQSESTSSILDIKPKKNILNLFHKVQEVANELTSSWKLFANFLRWNNFRWIISSQSSSRLKSLKSSSFQARNSLKLLVDSWSWVSSKRSKSNSKIYNSLKIIGAAWTNALFGEKLLDNIFVRESNRYLMVEFFLTKGS